jgi:hypothetical protein
MQGYADSISEVIVTRENKCIGIVTGHDLLHVHFFLEMEYGSVYHLADIRRME